MKNLLQFPHARHSPAVRRAEAFLRDSILNMTFWTLSLMFMFSDRPQRKSDPRRDSEGKG